MDRDRIEDLVEELVRDRSMDALETLTSSKHERTLAALIEAAGEILDAETPADEDDTILEEIQGHLVKCAEKGPLLDGLESKKPSVREFVLGCLGELGDMSCAEAMVNCLEDAEPSVRDAAAEHLSLLTDNDFGTDVAAWRQWLETHAALEKQREQEELDESRARAKAKQKVLDVRVDEDNEDSDGDDDDDDRPKKRKSDDDDDAGDDDDERMRRSDDDAD